jgi:hypothetical protein
MLGQCCACKAGASGRHISFGSSPNKLVEDQQHCIQSLLPKHSTAHKMAATTLLLSGQVLILILLASTASAKVVRGVDPAKASAFTGATFTCLDGSRTIPIERVNDDYCDCPGDGSDEPGGAWLQLTPCFCCLPVMCLF